MKEIKTRNKNYDMIRTIAIMLVVFCHCVEKIFIEFDYFNINSMSRIFKIVTFTIGRLGVPLFLCLTGALILKKEFNDEKDVLKFYKRNLLPLIVTYEIWNVIYSIFIYIDTGVFKLSDLIHEMIFITRAPVSNIWYMPVIIGMYVGLPFLSMIIKKISFKVVKIPFIISLVAFSIVPSINVIMSLYGLSNYYNILDLSILRGLYGSYMLAGYYIANEKALKKINNKILLLIFIISFGLTVYVQSLSNEKYIYLVWYDFFPLMISGITLFELLNRIKINNNIIVSITNFISKISLGIYYLHIILITIVGDFILKIKIINPFRVGILFELVFLSCIVIIYILSKSKIIKEKVFLVK